MRYLGPAVLTAMLLAGCSSSSSPVKNGTSASATVQRAAASLATPAPAAATIAPTQQPVQTSLPASPSPSPSPSTTARPSPSPTPTVAAAAVEVVWVGFEPSFAGLRFVGLIHNTATRSIEGMQVRWTAYDSSNAILQSFSSKVPPIPSGQTFTYVGGAGTGLINGTPVRVTLTVVDAGRLSDVPSTTFAVESPAIEKSTFTLAKSGQDYKVSAALTTGAQEVQRRDIVVTYVLRDASGAIVGAEFNRPSNIPDMLPPGTKFRDQTTVLGVQGTPTTVDVVAYPTPQ